MTKAVIDVGSNSVLLLVQQLDGNEWRTVLETSRVTGLGQGTKATGTLLEPGIQSTLHAVLQAFEVAKQAGAETVKAVGTMALRIASNTQQFLDRADSQATPVTVLSGNDEAKFGFLAVANDPLFAMADRLSIIDPGGHSTELVTAKREQGAWVTDFARSFPVGALGLRDGPLACESPGPRELLGGVDAIGALVDFEYLPGHAGKAVVLGATGTNLVAIRDKIEPWNPDLVHGQVLDFEEVSRAVGWLCGLTDEGRSRLIGLEPGRERTIHIGALILERFMQAIHVLDCTVSVRGWRHAYLQRGEA